MRRSRTGALLVSLSLTILVPAAVARDSGTRAFETPVIEMRAIEKGTLQTRILLAQTGSVLERGPPVDEGVTVIPAPPEEGVTAAPLPPPSDQMEPAETEPDMVPNPLQDPNVRPVPGARRLPPPPQGQAQRGGWVQMGTATLQALDKINARGATLVVKVGDTGKFGTLEITVRGCFVRTADRPADATALLAVRDQRAEAPVFTGWVVRSAPYMSMMTHPIYDVRIAGCAP